MNRWFALILVGAFVSAPMSSFAQGSDGEDTEADAVQNVGGEDPAEPPAASYDIRQRVKGVVKAAGALQTACAEDSPIAEPLGSACNEYCGDDATTFNFCALTSKPLAAVAVVVDFPGVEETLAHLRTRFADQSAALTELQDSLVIQDLQSAAGPLSVATTRILEVGLAALARLIQDRARRESIGWFLERIGGEVCGPVPAVPALGSLTPSTQSANVEIRQNWFPALCALSDAGQLSGYGAGAQLLRAFRAALAADVRGWPGAATGLAAGALHYRDIVGRQSPNPFRCRPDAEDPPCVSLRRFRGSIEAFVETLINGGQAATALEELSNELHDLNRTQRVPGVPSEPLGFRSPTTQLFACAAAFPAALSNYSEAFHNAGLSTHGGAAASALVALGTAPACWPLIAPAGSTAAGSAADAPAGSTAAGSAADAPEVSAAAGSAADAPAISAAAGSAADAPAVSAATAANPPANPRLRTLIKLYSGVRAGTAGLATGVARIRDASVRLQSLVNNGPTTGSSRPLPDLEGVATAESVGEALSAYDGYVRRGEDAPALHHARSVSALVLEVLSASLDITRSATSLFRTLSDADMLGGFAGRVRYAPGQNLRSMIVGAQHYVELLHEASGLVAAVVSGRWENVVMGAGTIFQRLPQQSAAGNEITTSVARQITRYMGVLTAILSEDDPDALAEMLDELAEPVGGWRRKHEAGSFVLSLTSFPGLWGGVERRWGPYGAVLERGSDLYAVAPTLSFPIGLDLAFGTRGGWSIGAFVSVLDPVAFLQYDTSNDGALPGAQLLTVLAPGLGLRVGLPNSPFTIMPMVVYRPSFRTEVAQLAGPGADVVQFGLLVSVDVTLFELHVSEAN